MHKKIALLILLLAATAALVLYAQPTVRTGSVSQKIIHIEKYEPMPGDIYTLSLDFGGGQTEPSSYTVMLQEDYILELPYIGSLNIKGMYFSQVRNTIVKRIKSTIPVQYISFSLTAPAQFEIFIYGQVKHPGMITVDSLTRLTDVVEAMGGFNSDAGTRKIEIRGKEIVKTFDLMNYYTSGAFEENPYMKPGYRIFVPIRKEWTVISGAVAEPGLYEIVPGDTLRSLIRYAGGYTATAKLDDISVLRLNDRNEYYFVSEPVDPATFELQNGDRLTVGSTLVNSDKITVEGAFYGKATENDDNAQSIPSTPLRFSLPYHPGFTLLEALESVGGPTPFAEPGKAYILRKNGGEKLPLPELSRLWETKDSSLNITLEPDDYLVVPIQKLKVFLSGEVNRPGMYDYIEGYTVADYLLLGGGLDPKRSNKNTFLFMDEIGKTTKAGIDSVVTPATHIVVQKNSWAKTIDFFADFFTITGWVTGTAAVVTAVLELVKLVRGM